MSAHVELQCAVDEAGLPDTKAFETWVRAVLDNQDDIEVLIRIVGDDESAQLNKEYRGKQGATNVLSFSFEVPEEVSMQELDLDIRPLGDLVMCAPVIREQAIVQGKSEQAHWAHMTVHGVLHLLGMDHQTKDEAEIMEAREIQVMSKLGFSSPYEDVQVKLNNKGDLRLK
jgi:probable rRNA maturation factor